MTFFLKGAARMSSQSARSIVAAGLILLGSSVLAYAQEAAGEPYEPKITKEMWSFAGPFGKFDKAQLQRGYKVYKEVCSNCHSMKFVSFRNLSQEGGPGFSEAEVKALAASVKVQDGPNDKGEMFERPGKPSDAFPRRSRTPRPPRSPTTALSRRTCRFSPRRDPTRRSSRSSSSTPSCSIRNMVRTISTA